MNENLNSDTAYQLSYSPFYNKYHLRTDKTDKYML